MQTKPFGAKAVNKPRHPLELIIWIGIALVGVMALFAFMGIVIGYMT
jgi:hypothetical protein